MVGEAATEVGGGEGVAVGEEGLADEASGFLLVGEVGEVEGELAEGFDAEVELDVGGLGAVLEEGDSVVGA